MREEEVAHAKRQRKRVFQLLLKIVPEETLLESIQKLQWMEFVDSGKITISVEIILETRNTIMNWNQKFSQLLLNRSPSF